MSLSADFPFQRVLDSINDGIYVTDLERRILYWSRSAEAITGWSANEVVGRKCGDNLLNHVDKDNHALCGEEFCPLHRAMATGKSSASPLLIFAQSKKGPRIPVQVSVAPIRNQAGEIVGGIENFRNYSELFKELQHAQKIQRQALVFDVPEDPRIRIRTHYIPHNLVGGDFYAIEPIDQDRYGVLLADVKGHGISSALYTMHFKSLYEEYKHLCSSPDQFVETINNRMYKLFRDNQSFATAMYAHIDLAARRLTLVSAGNPCPLHISPSGRFREIRCSGFALGMKENSKYESIYLYLEKGDRLLFVTDGALEIFDADHCLLDTDGLVDLLQSMDYPQTAVSLEAVEKALLHYSDQIRLEDDLTMIEIHYTGD
ncbi:MAG: SpoIIE family protein phosphatase [Candidatus Omnitrophica bacterium]|nr:SpoIIE family protein phosphatase [Candidatus Omnitrophota bacterium]